MGYRCSNSCSYQTHWEKDLFPSSFALSLVRMIPISKLINLEQEADKWVIWVFSQWWANLRIGSSTLLVCLTEPERHVEYTLWLLETMRRRSKRSHTWITGITRGIADLFVHIQLGTKSRLMTRTGHKHLSRRSSQIWGWREMSQLQLSRD